MRRGESASEAYLCAGEDRRWLGTITHTEDDSYSDLWVWAALELVPKGFEVLLDEELKAKLLESYADDGCGRNVDFDGGFAYWLNLHMGQELLTKIEKRER